MATLFSPEFLFQNGALRKGVSLCVSDDGRVLDQIPAGVLEVKLPNKLMIPGFVNAHSHAFQRIIRGRTEYVSASNTTDDFWSWREAMYLAANALSPEDIYAVSRAAFLEMLLAGYTSVGEFHYLHHNPNGTPYVDKHELANQVIAAATDVGIRIVLLRVVYQRAGFQMPANARQKRFIDSSVEESLFLTEDLRNQQSNQLIRVAIAPHSVRAVTPEGLKFISQSKQSVVHMHVAEQPGEVAACLKENQKTPVEFLDSLGFLNSRFTAVHAVHLTAAEKKQLGSGQVNVCACPSTERNLGDGIIEADELHVNGAYISLGSDSHAQIDALDEMRQLEGHLRLLRLKRNVLRGEGNEMQSAAVQLLQMGSKNGARSLGLNTGSLAPGEWADAVTFDIPALMTKPDALLSSLVFSGNTNMVRDVFVAGKMVVRDGGHVAQNEIRASYLKTLNAIF